LIGFCVSSTTLEEQRANHIRTRNHRLAIIRTFFEFIADRVPEMIAVAHRIGSIPSKRVPPPESRYLERREIKRLLAALPSRGQYADRDRTLLLFLYNTGARAQEAADLRVGHVEFEPQPRVRLHGKGDKWRLCPLWAETALQIRHLPAVQGSEHRPDAPVFLSQRGRALTRFGIYKIVRRHTDGSNWTNNDNRRHITPHVLRHTTAVHLLEAGVEINVIRGWLGHVRLETTNRYAEITLRGKEAALRACEPPLGKGACRKPVWRNDDALLSWLDSL